MRQNLNQPSERIPFVRSLRFALILLPLILGSLAPSLFAQPKAPPIPNRFLLIVDTSSAMKRHASDVYGVVNELIVGAASGQMHSGDSLGIWTFNTTVSSELPAQTWINEQRGAISMHTVEYLKHVPYGKASRLDKALSDMQDVIHSSDIITVFIVSTGEGKMRGTPFDDEINTQYARALKDMGKQQRPVVTVLQAKSGKIIRYTVTALPWPIVVPEIPIEIKVVQNQPQTPPQTPKAKVEDKTSPKTNIAPAVVPEPVRQPPLAVELPPLPPEPEAKPENIPAVASTAPNSNETSKIPLSSAPVVTPINPPTVTQNANAESATPLPPPPVRMTDNSIPRPRPRVVTNQTSVPITSPPSTVAKTIPPPAPVQLASNPAPVTVAPPQTNFAASPKPATNPAVIAQTRPATSSSTAQSSTNDVSSRALAFVAPETGTRSKSFLIAGIILAIIALLLVFMMIRRSRVTSGPSLITHSMGNRKK